MMVTVAMLRAAGLTEAQINRVCELADDEARAKRREENRIYKQNQRLRQQKSACQADSADATYKEPSFLSNRKKERTGRKTVMPIDWKPAIAPEDAAEFQRFTNYCKANAKVYADWDAAWRNWQTSPYRNRGQTNGNGRRHGSVLDATDRIDERLAQFGAREGYVPGTGGPQPLRLDQRTSPPGLKLIPKG